MEYTNRYRAPNHSGPGFYYAGQAISYAASITDKPVVLCSQSGCTHSDSSCMAYIGDARQFAEYQGQWYAIVKNSDIEYTFLKIDPTTRERQTLGHWIVEEQDILHVYGGRLAHGYAYVYIYQEKYNAQEIRFLPSEEHYERISLTTGENQVLSIDGSILAASETYVFTVDREYDHEKNLGPDPVYAILREYDLTGRHMPRGIGHNRWISRYTGSKYYLRGSPDLAAGRHPLRHGRLHTGAARGAHDAEHHQLLFDG